MSWIKRFFSAPDATARCTMGCTPAIWRERTVEVGTTYQTMPTTGSEVSVATLTTSFDSRSR